MRVKSAVILNNHCHAQGGASRVAIDEALSLAKLGIDVHFFGAVGPICDELLSEKIHVVCLSQQDLSHAEGRPSVMLQGIWNFQAASSFRQLLLTLKPEASVVHLHGFSQSLSTSVVSVATRMKFKVVATIHDFFLACPNGAFFNYKKSTLCKLQALSLDCVTTNCDKRRYTHKIYRVVRSLVQREIAYTPASIDHFIALSSVSEAVMRKYLPGKAHIHRLLNPIGVEHSQPVKVRNNKSIIFVGRLDEEKGVESLIVAASMTGVPITLIGDGPLRLRAESCGCRVTGWLSRADVLAEIESARCLIFPSLWYETFGLVVDEASARGVPSIVSDISAASERVEDGVSGWHFRSGDAVDLARCIRFLKNDEAVESAGSNAFSRWWSAPSTQEQHSMKLLEVYESMLAP